jgi:hypothetical protein
LKLFSVSVSGPCYVVDNEEESPNGLSRSTLPLKAAG